MARLLTNLGEFLIAQKEPQRAEQSLLQALAIQERELGSQHPETARTLSGLGDVQRLLGNDAAASRFYQQAYAIFFTCHGAEHFRTKRVQAQLDQLPTT
ncbi:MAG: hypothetical protein Fur005_26130 [Roseiflexaceae bacterium]